MRIHINNISLGTATFFREFTFMNTDYRAEIICNIHKYYRFKAGVLLQSVFLETLRSAMLANDFKKLFALNKEFHELGIEYDSPDEFDNEGFLITF